MSLSSQPTAIIVGVGPFTSRALSIYLASKGYNIGLICRTRKTLEDLAAELKLEHADINVAAHVADSGNATSLVTALDALKGSLGHHVDVLIYNAARVAPSALMNLAPDVLERDFRTSAVGTLVAGQWFSEHANTQGKEKPLLLITGGVLDRDPNADYAALSIAKAASQNIGVMFSKTMPEKYGILVGTPLLVEPIIPDGEKGGYLTKSDPDVIVDKIMRPYFEAREQNTEPWVVERIW